MASQNTYNKKQFSRLKHQLKIANNNNKTQYDKFKQEICNLYQKINELQNQIKFLREEENKKDNVIYELQFQIKNLQEEDFKKNMVIYELRMEINRLNQVNVLSDRLLNSLTSNSLTIESSSLFTHYKLYT